jgi:hypothetical protein
MAGSSPSVVALVARKGQPEQAMSLRDTGRRPVDPNCAASASGRDGNGHLSANGDQPAYQHEVGDGGEQRHLRRHSVMKPDGHQAPAIASSSERTDMQAVAHAVRAWLTQPFLSTHAFVYQHVHPRRHRMASDRYRASRAIAYKVKPFPIPTRMCPVKLTMLQFERSWRHQSESTCRRPASDSSHPSCALYYGYVP